MCQNNVWIYSYLITDPMIGRVSAFHADKKHQLDYDFEVTLEASHGHPPSVIGQHSYHFRPLLLGQRLLLIVCFMLTSMISVKREAVIEQYRYLAPPPKWPIHGPLEFNHRCQLYPKPFFGQSVISTVHQRATLVAIPPLPSSFRPLLMLCQLWIRQNKTFRRLCIFLN